jgi:hypothetical protein
MLEWQNSLLAKSTSRGLNMFCSANSTDWGDQAKALFIENHEWIFPGEAISASSLKVAGRKNLDFLINGKKVFSIENDH